MAAPVSKLSPPAAQATPDQETREQGLRALRLELEAQSDDGLAALLQHEIARLHERREDLASAARDELATTKRAASFVEPIESLIDIATRSRSKANLAKLLERLTKLARTGDEKVRAALALALTHLAGKDLNSAQTVIESALEDAPTDPTLWIALETVAAESGDSRLLLKAATGRAAHSESDEMRCLLLERAARLHIGLGEPDSAFAALRQSVDEIPTWRALHTWEELGVRAENYLEAAQAAAQNATILRAGLEEPEEATLYQIPEEELSEERAIAAQIRSIIYSLRAGDEETARGQCEQLCEASTDSALALCLLEELCRRQGDAEGATDALSRLIDARKWSANELAALQCLKALASRDAGNEEATQTSLEQLQATVPTSKLPQVQRWIESERADSLEELNSLLGQWEETLQTSDASGDANEAKSLRSARCLVKMLSGAHDEAALLLDPDWETAEDAGVTPLFAYVLGQISPETAARPSLPPTIGSESDRHSLNWEAARASLLETGKDFSPKKLNDAWAAVAHELRHPSAPGLSEPRERLGGESSQEEVAHQNIPDAAESKAEETDEALIEFASEDEDRDADAEAATTEDDQDGIVVGLLEDSEAPGDSEPVDEEEPVAPTHESVPPPSRFRSIIDEYLSNTDVSPEVARGLRAHQLAAFGDGTSLKEQWDRKPEDPLLAGALCALLETTNDETLAQVRRQSAENLEDETLRGAWLLKSAAESLERGRTKEAIDSIKASSAINADEGLAPWFTALQGEDDPRERLESQKLSPPSGDDELEFAALLQRWAPDDSSSFEFDDPSPALQLLQVLQTATHSLEALEYALDETELFSVSERAALHLARNLTPDEADEFLTAARRWVKKSPSLSSHLALWVAGTRARNSESQKEAIESLAHALNLPQLIASVPASLLKKEQREKHRSSLTQLRQEAETQTKAPDAALSWSLLEQTSDEISDEHAQELLSLGRSLDGSLEDPDAQTALLWAGFEFLALKQFEEALEIFEPLLEHLPGDLTLCQGTRIAAAAADRPDLEALTTCELARSTEDNQKSAQLWERAGVLYQDALEDPEEAERCFTSALVRSPGSRLSFERVYRFARERNDRQRQVELIDARLDTAESESLQVELYWEKARFCRMLGRRTIALRSLEELLKLASDHLPALALSAELHLVDGRIDAAAEALRAVAKHPDTPAAQRSAAGLHACDLFEQLRLPREAVELLQLLDEYGVSGSAGLERRARSLARSEDWGEAFKAFSELNGEQDEIETRLESARMMLAIQRDHLKDSEELKRSARCVLRDDPLDPDAILVVLQQSFPQAERQRLLEPAREQSLEILRKTPLNPPEIRRFAGLCLNCGDDELERVALGNLGLTGKLSPEYSERLEELLSARQTMPTSPLSRGDLEALADPLQLGSAGRYLQLITPYLGEELDPSLDALGFSSLMRTDEFSGSPHRAEIGTWVACFGHSDFELYVGGAEPTLIRGVHGDLPTLLIGKEVQLPLTPIDRARVAAQLSALHYDMVTFVNHSPELLERWVIASEILAGRKSSPETAGEIDEMARKLSRRVPREVREEITHLREELTRAGVRLSHAPYVVLRGAARAACMAQGEPNIIRQLPLLLPSDPEFLNLAMADLIRFALSNEFRTIRRRVGLEGA